MINPVTKIRFYSFDDFQLDILNCELLKNGEHIAFTQKSFKILQFLIENRTRILKKDEILSAIWTEEFVADANLAQHIYMIRKVLRDNGGKVNYIETIPKYGYRFVGFVTERQDEILKTSKPFLANNFHPNSSRTIDNNLENIEFEDKNTSSEKFNKAPSPLTKNKRLLQFPIVVFAGIFILIISSFVYLAFYNFPNKQKDITNIESISILPFKQIGGNADEKLRLGLADTLISRLSNQNKISISPTAKIETISSSNYSDSLNIGEKLNVDAILTGTIQREDNLVRVNVQLISIDRKVPIWSDKFDVEFSNIFSLQDQISEKLASKLSIELEKPPKIRLNDGQSPIPEANIELAKGLKYWNERSDSNLPKAIHHFENAIKYDSKFAKAYAHLADCYSLIGVYKIKQIMPPNLAIKKAKQTVNKAIELDSNSSEAYMALAMIALHKKEYKIAQNLFKKATRLDPSNATAHLRLGWVLTTEEDLNEAITEMRLAHKANPKSLSINTSLANLLRLNGQTDEALNYVKKAVKMDPTKNLARVILAEVYEQKGQLDKSIKELESLNQNAPEEKSAKLVLSRVYAKKGNKKEARKMLKDLSKLKNKNKISTYEVATVYAHLGEKKQAVKKLQKAKNDSLTYFLNLKYDYNIDPLRDTPEYSELLTQSKIKISKVADKNS